MAGMWCFGYSTLQMHIVRAVKYVCNNTGEPVNKEAGSNHEASIRDITMEDGHQVYIL
jgi:hypothetical protein